MFNKPSLSKQWEQTVSFIQQDKTRPLSSLGLLGLDLIRQSRRLVTCCTACSVPSHWMRRGSPERPLAGGRQRSGVLIKHLHLLRNRGRSHLSLAPVVRPFLVQDPSAGSLRLWFSQSKLAFEPESHGHGDSMAIPDPSARLS